ncbi:MAG TPA: glycosyltransferase family 2 protein [Thermoplasmata archaeon]|nr:glycosyltransferase family 2 protein [Thermoplasmata archaeon]
MPSPSVLVLVLNYNAGPALEACLTSLLRTNYSNVRIVVLDNGSTDCSDQIPDRLGITVHRFGENLLYCGAYNRALREMRGDADFVLLSNPDIVVPPETIGKMVGLATSDPKIGFVGPVQRRSDTREVRSAGVRWRCGHLPKNVFAIGGLIDAVEGAFVLIRRNVIEEVGLLDEAFAINFEDVDMQLRARRYGYRSAIAVEAEILHDPPGTARRLAGAYYQARNVCILTERYCPRRALLQARFRLYAEGIVGRVLGRPRAPFILDGLRDYRRGVTGIKRVS